MIRKPANEWRPVLGLDVYQENNAGDRWIDIFTVANARDVFYAGNRMDSFGALCRVIRRKIDCDLTVFGGPEGGKWKVQVEADNAVVLLEFDAEHAARGYVFAAKKSTTDRAIIALVGPDGEIVPHYLSGPATPQKPLKTKDQTMTRRPASEWELKSGDLLQWWDDESGQWADALRMISTNVANFSKGLMKRDSDNHRVVRFDGDGAIFGGRESPPKYPVGVEFSDGRKVRFTFRCERDAGDFIEAARSCLDLVRVGRDDTF